MQRILIIIISAIIFSSCANKSQSDLEILKAAQEGFEQSNKTILYSTEKIYKALEQKLSAPETAQHAAIWQPKATVVKEITKNIINYIEELISKIAEDNKADAVNNLFLNEKRGDELYNKLKKYKQNILAVDPEILNVFGQNAVIITEPFEADTNKGKDFTSTFFYQQSSIGALTILRKFENNVRILENELVTFCFNEIASTDGDGLFTQIGFLIGQSSNYIKAGDEMEIQAGVGSFSVRNNPVFTINGKVLKLEPEGVALYKFKTPHKTGKYKVPVKIEYIDVDGSKKVRESTVAYTVVE